MALRANYEIAVIFVIFLIVSPVSALLQNHPSSTGESIPSGSEDRPYTVRIFTPTATQVHSTQIMDQINGPDGDVIIATAFGLSTFNGSWSTLHTNHNNISQGLMDDFITAIEYDHLGNLWIGSSGGIQVFNGVYYRVIRDQQLLKENRIHDLQRWNNDMWISTGHAGIHRYRDGTWTWFQPMAKDGPGFYEIDSMTLDTASNSLLVATRNEGLWIVRSFDDPVSFEQLVDKDSTAGQMQHVKRDPLGGAYFFNQEKILHYDTVSGFKEILTTADLTLEQITINDLAAGSDGNLNLATDDGIYIWRDGGIFRHLSRFEGIGTSDIVKTINVDAKNRVWFATSDSVGYYLENTPPEEQLKIDMVTPKPSLIPIILLNETPVRSGPASSISSPSGLSSIMTIFSRISDPIVSAFNVIAQKFGLNISS